MHLSHSSVSVSRVQTRFFAIFKGANMALTLRLCGNQKSLYTFGYKFYQGFL